MAKLIVNFSNKFQTGALYSHNEKSYVNSGAKLLGIFSKAKPETLGIEVVAVNKGEEIVFICDRSCGKKDSSLIVTALPDGSGLEAEVAGVFEVKLRAGVAPVLQAYGDKLDLRIRAVTSNGGAYGGFASYVSGITEPTDELKSYLKHMPKVKGVVK